MITFNKRRDYKVSLHRTRDAVVYRAVSYLVNFPCYFIYHPSICRSYIYISLLPCCPCYPENTLMPSEHRRSLSLFVKFRTSVKGAQRDQVRRGEKRRDEQRDTKGRGGGRTRLYFMYVHFT